MSNISKVLACEEKHAFLFVASASTSTFILKKVSLQFENPSI